MVNINVAMCVPECFNSKHELSVNRILNTNKVGKHLGGLTVKDRQMFLMIYFLLNYVISTKILILTKTK